MPASDDQISELVPLLTAELTREPGQTAKQLARTLGLNAKEINPILYHQKSVFEPGTGPGSAPLWFVVGTVADLTPYEKPVSSKKSSNDDGEAPEIIDEFTGIFDNQEFDDEAIAKFTKSATGPRPAVANPKVSEDNPLGLYNWQIEALAAWRRNGSKGIVDAVTGAGKTRLAVAAIADQLAAEGKAMVLVPTVVLLYQWEEILNATFPKARIGLAGDGHDDTFARHDVIIGVLATTRNRRFPLEGAHGLLVVDECHRAGAEKSAISLGPQFDHRLGLSATHERMDDAHKTILLPYFTKVVYTLTYERAIADGVISNVRTAFVGVNFTEEEQGQYILLQRNLNKLRKKLIYDIGVRSQPFSAFLDDVVRLASGGKRAEGMVAQKWLKAWGDKKALLAETPAKANGIAALKGAISDADRTLIFTQSIKSANAIAAELIEQGIAAAPHHSEIEMNQREDILGQFANGELTVLVSVQTLEEGVDVPDADLAIIVASSKQRRQMVQRMGRVLRRKSDGRDARFIILFVALTDEDPRLGAHETFVEELIDVARDSMIGDLTMAEQLRAFLSPKHPEDNY